MRTNRTFKDKMMGMMYIYTGQYRMTHHGSSAGGSNTILSTSMSQEFHCGIEECARLDNLLRAK